MITVFFEVTVDIPDHIDLDTEEFDKLFYDCVAGSSESGITSCDGEQLYAIFSSQLKAVECETKFTEGLKRL